MIMLDYLAMACKDSDYIVVIAIVHCPHHTLSSFGPETHLGGGDTSAFEVLSGCHCSVALLEVCRQYSSYKGPTKILTTQV